MSQYYEGMCAGVVLCLFLAQLRDALVEWKSGRGKWAWPVINSTQGTIAFLREMAKGHALHHDGVSLSEGTLNAIGYAARQYAEAELARSESEVEKLGEALTHLFWITHKFNPDVCDGCANVKKQAEAAL